MRTETFRYLSVTESAKLLRAALKREFPGVKFSVRSESYSGGSSIRVAWLDGPTRKRVQALCDRHKAADFDGMIDMESGRYHWLTPQGEIYVAEVSGTEASRGTISTQTFIKPHDDAELVHLGGKYITAERKFSRAMLERAAAWAEEEWGERPEIREHSYGGGFYFHAEAPTMPGRFPGGQWDTIADVANREMWQQNGPKHADRFA